MRNSPANQQFLKLWLPLMFTGTVLALAQALDLILPAWGEQLQWSRSGVNNGEWWRLLTGHWVHLGVTHWLLNLSGLGLLMLLFDRPAPVVWWVAYLLTAPIAISVGLLWFMPELDWYRGFSGCLHGLFVLVAMANLRPHPVWSAALLAGLAVKLVAEVYVPTGTANLIGAAVIYPSHWLGALTGLVAAGIMLISQKTSLSRTPSPPSAE